MRCERRLYGISGIAFYRVGKAECLQLESSRWIRSEGWRGREGAGTQCHFAAVTVELQDPRALSEHRRGLCPTAAGLPILKLVLKIRRESYCSQRGMAEHRRISSARLL